MGIQELAQRMNLQISSPEELVKSATAALPPITDSPAPAAPTSQLEISVDANLDTKGKDHSDTDGQVATEGMLDEKKSQTHKDGGNELDFNNSLITQEDVVMQYINSDGTQLSPSAPSNGKCGF